MTETNVERVYMEDASSHRWHVALREAGKEPSLPDACNIQGDRAYYAELPDDIDPDLLCTRCFG